MATIKLGDKTLGTIAFGGTKLGDARTLNKQKIFRAEVFKNHGNKLVTYAPSPIAPVEGLPNEPTTDWLLNNGVWQDTGVWDDTQIWND